jgi:hypothetical protein
MNTQMRKVGDIRITNLQAQVLKFMSDAKKQDWVALPLDEVHMATIKVLLREGWIYESPGPDGMRYRITVEGERAAKLGNLPKASHRTDGICPRCCERPRYTRTTGELAPYCTECSREHARRTYALGVQTVKTGRMCSRCKKRPVKTRSSGRVITYCDHCHNVMNRRGKKRWHKQKLERIRQGEVLLCTRPDCTNPRHYTERTVYDWCLDHHREWHTAYRQRKATQS